MMGGIYYEESSLYPGYVTTTTISDCQGYRFHTTTISYSPPLSFKSPKPWRWFDKFRIPLDVAVKVATAPCAKLARRLLMLATTQRQRHKRKRHVQQLRTL